MSLGVSLTPTQSWSVRHEGHAFGGFWEMFPFFKKDLQNEELVSFFWMSWATIFQM